MDITLIDSINYPKIWSKLDKKSYRNFELECIMLQLYIHDQFPRKGSINLDPYFTKLANDCSCSKLNTQIQNEVDSINLLKLNDLKYRKIFPEIHNLYNGFLLDVTPLVLVHQPKIINDEFIEDYLTLTLEKSEPYDHLIMLMKNRIWRFKDKNGYSKVTMKFPERNKFNEMICYLYAAHQIVSDNTNMNISVDLNTLYQNILDEKVLGQISHKNLTIKYELEFPLNEIMFKLDSK